MLLSKIKNILPDLRRIRVEQISVSSKGEILVLFQSHDGIVISNGIGYHSKQSDECANIFFWYAQISVFAVGDSSYSLCCILIWQTLL